MLVPVGILAVLAVIGGWIQFAPFWHPLTNWLEPVAQTLAVAEPKNWQEALSSVLAVGLGLAGIGVAWAMYGTGSVAVPRLPVLQQVLEHKFYFDEAYDRLFYAPAVALANYLRGTVEDEWILPAGGEFATATLGSGRLRRAACRPACCARTSSSSAAGWPCRDRLPPRQMTRLVVHLPAHLAADRRRDRRVGAAALEVRDRRARRARVPPRGRHLDRAARALPFLAERRAVRAEDDVDQGLARLVPRRRVRILALARRPHRRRDGGGDRLRLLGRP